MANFPEPVKSGISDTSDVVDVVLNGDEVEPSWSNTALSGADTVAARRQPPQLNVAAEPGQDALMKSAIRKANAYYICDGITEEEAKEAWRLHGSITDAELAAVLRDFAQHQGLDGVVGNLTAVIANNRNAHDPLARIGGLTGWQQRAELIDMLQHPDGLDGAADTLSKAKSWVRKWRNPPVDNERVSQWRFALETVAEGMEGAEPDFMDTRRPEGRRIMPRSPDGVVVEWVGRTGMHKTGAAIAEAIEAAVSGENVLYIPLEDPAGVKKVRIPAALARRGIAAADLPNFRTWCEQINLFDEQQVRDFISMLDAYGDPVSLIFIDVVTLAVGERDPASGAFGIGLLSALTRIASAFGATVIAITHPPEGSTGNKMHAFGSSLQGSLVYATLLFTYSEKTQRLRIHVKKMKNGEEQGFDVYMRNEPADGVPVIVDISPEEWPASAEADDTAQDDQPDAEPDTFRADVVAALAGATEPMPVKAVVTKMLGPKADKTTAASLNKRIRRRMARGCLTDLAVRTNGKIAEPAALMLSLG